MLYDILSMKERRKMENEEYLNFEGPSAEDLEFMNLLESIFSEDDWIKFYDINASSLPDEDKAKLVLNLLVAHLPSDHPLVLSDKYNSENTDFERMFKEKW